MTPAMAFLALLGFFCVWGLAMFWIGYKAGKS